MHSVFIILETYKRKKFYKHLVADLEVVFLVFQFLLKQQSRCRWAEFGQQAS
jgi:hypothetical protein